MEPVNIDLKDKIILITGGASGIGLSLTKQSVHLGARVLVADLRTTSDFDGFVNGNPNVLYVQTDVSRWSDLLRLFDECEKKWSDIPDAYGICAGVFEPAFSNFWYDPEQEGGYKQVDINVDHPIKLTRLAIKKSLGRGKRSSVCIISSIGGLGGSIAAPLYCATKHAIVGFTKSMRESETLTGVKVTTICPGLVNTPLITDDKSEQFSFSEEKSLSPDDVAKHMLDLIQKKEFSCGTVYEVSLGGTRTIPDWNIAPPSGTGTGQDEAEIQAGASALLAPITAALAKEKSPKL